MDNKSKTLEGLVKFSKEIGTFQSFVYGSTILSSAVIGIAGLTYGTSELHKYGFCSDNPDAGYAGLTTIFSLGLLAFPTSAIWKIFNPNEDNIPD